MSNENKQPDERAAFERDYVAVWNKALTDAGWTAAHTIDDVKDLREGDTYGEGRDYLNGRWEGWQARATQQATMCPACGGNDADMPCAFPRGGQPGCPRDARLGRNTQQATKGDERAACPSCGGSQSTWKCTCDPIWPGYNGEFSATGVAEVDRIVNRLMSSDPQFDDCADAADLIRRLVKEHQDLAGELRSAIATPPSPVAGSAGQAPLTDEQRAALKHLVARGSTFPDHNGRSGSTSRVDYAHLQVAAKVLSSILAAPTAPSLTTDAGALTNERINAMWDQVNDARGHARADRSVSVAVQFARALLAAHPTEQRPDPSDIQGWAVTVNVNTVDILTIGHNSLSGIDNISDFAEVVRNCAKHLMGFIGDDRTEQRMSDAARECEWTYDDVDFKWDSACGESWVFNDDGPVENKVRFCHGCGGRVTIAARKAEIERSGGGA
ncbi:MULTISPECIES: hypothetical protein [unclassified Paraburkholderia]|uniref:hypothetical protein n=1 Tax=unclassified Paraburkholderia TaxID=2615204 RepID=UPI002AB1D9FD|nr:MULTISPECIES: hypothetical protein [unclassified Paraburkholderia]